jgi:DUF2934 family protein
MESCRYVDRGSYGIFSRIGGSYPERVVSVVLPAGTAVAEEVAMSKRKRADSSEGATPQMAVETTLASPDRERIATRAYELYLARGGGDGQADQDWLTAERELSNARQSTRES